MIKFHSYLHILPEVYELSGSRMIKEGEAICQIATTPYTAGI